jgi:hypothetical protein
MVYKQYKSDPVFQSHKSIIRGAGSLQINALKDCKLHAPYPCLPALPGILRSIIELPRISGRIPAARLVFPVVPDDHDSISRFYTAQ